MKGLRVCAFVPRPTAGVNTHASFPCSFRTFAPTHTHTLHTQVTPEITRTHAHHTCAHARTSRRRRRHGSDDPPTRTSIRAHRTRIPVHTPAKRTHGGSHDTERTDLRADAGFFSVIGRVLRNFSAHHAAPCGLTPNEHFSKRK